MTAKGLWVESRGSGAAVVLLHGAGMDGRLWDAVFPDLARDHLAIRYDARGLGRSATPERPYNDVEDLAAVLDHAGVDRAALVGVSMGGETALDFALEHAERVTALVLVGPSVGGYDWPDTPELAAYATARRDGDAQALAKLLIVHGDRDHPEIASIAELLVARIPGAAGEVVPDADHYLPLRAPRRLAGLLRAHLKRVPR